jgi:hypothetical protein
MAFADRVMIGGAIIAGIIATVIILGPVPETDHDISREQLDS